MSAVDVTKPEEVEATTASVRANMAVIKTELEVAEAHYAAADPHPQYTTVAEATALAEAAAAGVTVPVQSVAGKTGDVTLVKADVGLGAVDNKSSATIRSEITAANIAAPAHGAALKATPVDADEVTGLDSAASFSLIRVTWASIKATLKTYFDTLYAAAATLTSHTSATNPHSGSAATGAVGTSGITMSTARLLGRTTAATGAVEEITLGANLSLAAGSLAVTPSGTTKQIQYNAAGALAGVPQFEFDSATNELRLGVGLTYNNNTGTLTLRQKTGSVANLLEMRNAGGLLTCRANDDGSHFAPVFLDPVASLRTNGYIENSGRYVDSALGTSGGVAGEVLIISTASPSTSKKAAVTDRAKIPVGVGAWVNAPAWTTYRGKETVKADAGAIAIGDRLVMSATTDGLVCADTTNNIALATVGYALSAKAGGSASTVTAWIHPTPGYKTLTAESLTTVGVVKQTVYTVDTLPSASTSGNGARTHVSDALAPTFGATVASGGAVSTPVYSDGTSWKVG